MTAPPQTKYGIIHLLIFILLLQTAAAAVTIQQENDANAAIMLVDVSVGATKEESACIFKVNGNTVVVNRHQTETYDGITIFVEEVYPVNTEARDQDRCKFLYSIAGQTATKESAVQQEIISGQIVHFLLGTRADLEAQTRNGEDQTTADQGARKVINDNTAVKIDGYDVTGLDTASNTKAAQADITKTNAEETTKSTENIGFFGKIFRFLFG
ncbi:hypothetical protein HZA99_04775 [Candidatus Woesearchaeota archaeon]|nr:hypothetical protein [Candidatus Woesearchaeota archaeon]